METKVGSGAGEAAITPLCSGWGSWGGHDLPETHTEHRDPANPPEDSRPPDAETRPEPGYEVGCDSATTHECSQ